MISPRIATGKGLSYEFKVIAEISTVLYCDKASTADGQLRSDISRHDRYLIRGARVDCVMPTNGR